MKTGLISDIQRASTHDGEGYRTTVFFKGCPLKCKWCHNPETIKPTPEILAYPEKCIGCNMCDKGCFSGARVVCGKEMTANELLNEILLDFPYYTNGGGVTFSGGEPLMQRDFLLEIINLCKDKGISVAIETSLIYLHSNTPLLVIFCNSKGLSHPKKSETKETLSADGAHVLNV